MSSQSDKVFNLGTAANPEHRLGDEHLSKQRTMATVVKKSFILSNNEEEDDADGTIFRKEVRSVLNRKEEAEKLKKLASSKDFFDRNYWKYLISKNIDLFTVTMLELNALLLTYPLNTIKTRVQAKHPFEDVSNFLKNQVDKQSLYQGISQGLMGIFLGNLISINTYRYVQIKFQSAAQNTQSPVQIFWHNLIGHLCGDLTSFPIRHLFDARKQFFQMNEIKFSLNQVMKSYSLGFAPALLRDIIFRLSFNFTNQLLLYTQYYVSIIKGNDNNFDLVDFENRIEFQKRVSSLITATMIASILSNPFDVVAVKMMTQQYDKYHGLRHALKTVIHEEKMNKLLFSGISSRVGFYAANGFIVMACYPRFRKMVDEAYSF